MASEWQTAFAVSHKMPWCALLTAVKNYNKSLEKLQDFFFKTETKTKYSRPRPRLHDPRPRPRVQDFHFCPRGASRPRPWSRGLHHCIKVTWIDQVPMTVSHLLLIRSNDGPISNCFQDNCNNCRKMQIFQPQCYCPHREVPL